MRTALSQHTFGRTDPPSLIPSPVQPPDPPSELHPRDDLHGPGGCGFSGCAFALVALFAVLLAVMVALALLRPWPTPLIPGR